MSTNQKKTKKQKRGSNAQNHERTTIQLRSGPTKAYTKRNPLSQKLRPLPGNSNGVPSASKRGRSSKSKVSESVLSETAVRFERSILLEDYDHPTKLPQKGRANSLNPIQASRGPFRRMASEGHYGNGQMQPRPCTELKQQRIMSGKARCHSEMNWRPVVNITRNNTIILPSLKTESEDSHPDDLTLPPPLPRIETTEADDEGFDNMDDDSWPPPKRFLGDLEDEDEDDDFDRNMLLSYLKKGVRPSITPNNSIDKDSTSASTPDTNIPILEAPEIEGAFEAAHMMTKSTLRIRCHDTVQNRVENREKRPQVLKRVSIGDDLTLTFTKGTKAIPTYSNSQWNSNRSLARGKVPKTGQTFSALKKSDSLSSTKSHSECTRSNASFSCSASPSACKKKKTSPSDDEIIAMYRQGLLSTTSRGENSRASSNTNCPPSTNRPESFDSQYSSPIDQGPEMKVIHHKQTDKIETIFSEPSTRSSSSQRYRDSESGISRGATVASCTDSNSDSRKPSDPNCLQIPGISAPLVIAAVTEEKEKLQQPNQHNELTDGPQLYWDSKSSTPALLDPPDMESRPLSCTSSLADASLLLENDDIASLPGSPFPNAKPGVHPRLSRRSSSVDSGISRPGSDFLEIPLTTTVSAKDKIPCMMTDSPGDSPIASPVSMLSENSRYSEDRIQHQVIHRISGGLSPCASPELPAPPPVPHVELERKTSEGLVAPAVSLTTDDGDDYAVWFGRRGSIFIEEKGPQPPPPQLQTTTDESGQVSLAVPNLPN